MSEIIKPSMFRPILWPCFKLKNNHTKCISMMLVYFDKYCTFLYPLSLPLLPYPLSPLSPSISSLRPSPLSVHLPSPSISPLPHSPISFPLPLSSLPLLFASPSPSYSLSFTLFSQNDSFSRVSLLGSRGMPSPPPRSRRRTQSHRNLRLKTPKQQ